MTDKVVVECKVASAHHKTETVNALDMTAPRIRRTDDRILHSVVVVI